MKFVSVWAVAALAAQAAGAALRHQLNGFTLTEHPDPEKRALLQKYVGVLIHVASDSHGVDILGAR